MYISRGASGFAPRLCDRSITLYLQPEHEAQHSADEQQFVCAAAATLANPRVMTAIKSITFNFFIDVLLFLKDYSYCFADESSAR